MPLIEVGTPASEFNLQDQNGSAYTLDHFAGAPLVMFFYPKDDTPGCTKESCAFRDLTIDFKAAGAAVVGISPDGVDSHAKFATKFSLPFPLLADGPIEKGETPPVCDAYGVWAEKSMYGRTYMGVVRTTYLIAGDGRVAQRWDRVKVPGHAEAVLQAIRELS